MPLKYLTSALFVTYLSKFFHFSAHELLVLAIFQVFDLQYASPATVSRCGMVYVDPKNLGYEPFWKKWVNTRNNKQEREWLQQLYEKYVPAVIDMIIEGVVDGKQGEKMKTITPLTNLNLVRASL